MRIRQKTGESLREYWKRLNEEILKIKRVDSKIAFIFLKNGLWDHRVVTDINLKKLKDLHSLAQRIHEFIRVDDELASRASLAGGGKNKRKQDSFGDKSRKKDKTRDEPRATRP